MFDTVIIVDWSAPAAPSPARPSADAIWIGSAGATEEITYHRTRSGAERCLIARLDTERKAGRRVLVGFDFPMGYPIGFARWLLGSPRHSRDVWAWMAVHIKDGEDNRNNRFMLANDLNHKMGQPMFWGRPSGLQLPHLPTRKPPTGRFPERRQVDLVVPRAQPVWKLFTTGSVGSQTLMGLPMIARLSIRPGCAVWPFDAVDKADIVIAEVYPSLINAVVMQATAKGEIKDSAQVRLLAKALYHIGRQGALRAMFSDTPQAEITREEGWILGAGQAANLLAAL